MKRSAIIISIVVLLVLVGIYLSYETALAPEMGNEDILPGDAPKQVTISGESVCLPHKEKGDFQTLECAIGLRDNDGSYYAIDQSGLPTQFYETGQRVSVSGLLVPIEQLGSDHWQIYDIKGIIKAEVLKVI